MVHQGLGYFEFVSKWTETKAYWTLGTLRGESGTKRTMYWRWCDFDSSFWHLSPNLSLSLFFQILFSLSPICLPLMSCFFLFPSDFLFHFRASLAKVLSAAARASCLTFASLTLSLCALNRNPVNPSSNGVHWEPYQT